MPPASNPPDSSQQCSCSVAPVVAPVVTMPKEGKRSPQEETAACVTHHDAHPSSYWLTVIQHVAASMESPEVRMSNGHRPLLFCLALSLQHCAKKMRKDWGQGVQVSPLE